MYAEGVSTREVTDVTRELCGREMSAGQVSRAAKLLEEEIEEWRTRELGDYRYLILDAPTRRSVTAAACPTARCSWPRE